MCEVVLFLGQVGGFAKKNRISVHAAFSAWVKLAFGRYLLNCLVSAQRLKRDCCLKLV